MFARIPSARKLTTLVCIVLISALPAMAGAASTAQVTHPEKLFANGKARHFTYKTGDGVAIRYFILKSSDGVIRAAFDACDVCWPENRGYIQRGDFMVCKNCGRQFPSVRINEVSGGCNPAPLARTLANGTVIITVADILEGKGYFDFRR